MDTESLIASLAQHGQELAHWLSANGRTDPRWKEKAASLLEPINKELTDAGVLKPETTALRDRPAFPVWSIQLQNWMPGMTYRQYLIGQALAGVLSSNEDIEAASPAHAVKMAASSAIRFADTVLELLDIEKLDEQVEKGGAGAEAP